MVGNVTQCNELLVAYYSYVERYSQLLNAYLINYP